MKIMTLLVLLLAVPAPVQAGDPLYLQAGGARLIRLNAPASNVFVANPNVADVQVKSPRLIYLYGRQAGETTMFAVGANDQVLLDRNVVVGANIDHLNHSLKTLFPAADVRASMVNQSLMLSGQVTRASDADQIRRLALQYIDDETKLFDRTVLTSPNQVTLRVRVAEVSREITKQLGVNWDFTKTLGGLTLGLVTGNPAAALIPNAASIARSGSLNFEAVVDALDEQGMISILAEPNLTAVSGEEASFLAGGEFPILVPTGNGDVTVEFKEYGVQLKFTPTVLDSNRINLRVNPEVSQLSSSGAVEISGYQIPSLTTRRTDTVVELGSGQSLAIAGFLQRDSEHDINKFPGLGDVPVLGALFRSDAFQRKETELVIMVTAYIVNPVESLRLAAPNDGFQLPHDRERILHGAQWTDTPEPDSNPEGAVIARLGDSERLQMDLTERGPQTAPSSSARPTPTAITAPSGGPSLIGPIGFEYD
ncbi:MAG: type II and III secretion system protein family protein [Gammaproteobacteria bacterium]|nr:type II and III secretion system protein family protein [Gammaproteobacteria bacterium]MCP5135560.1 type II and III secretion system protein family protein [Gammaproteobacteria bacterium]